MLYQFNLIFILLTFVFVDDNITLIHQCLSNYTAFKTKTYDKRVFMQIQSILKILLQTKFYLLKI